MAVFNYIFLATFSVLMLSICRSDDQSTEELVPMDLELAEDICNIPIDEGICESESVSDSNGDTAVYFGYNVNTTNCEMFIYEGCGGNGNRFDSSAACWRACYTPFRYFLARVTNFIKYRYNDSIDWTAE
ncbi:kunitz-type serine protease inhibitor conotoxin Cal9.1a-like [Helicoverpa zea]|uniref:kunitz-type serine protease inhibitor conotoxin Cal9.1a-like n=1 Tax=Helicoverpa zea TaxID=7113 RepID=UPI001F565147|nr:kunitz-type serine protease inhibitor conotoxin Cal9.1a-like [Helicoverpa zea]